MENPREFISQHPILSTLTPREVDLLLAHAEEIHLEAGETLFRQGEISDSVYLNISGKLLAYIEGKTHDGKNVHIGPGELIGELGLWESSTRTLSIKALEPSFLVRVANEMVQPLLILNPKLHLTLSQLVVRRFKEVVARWSNTKTFCNIVLLPICETDSSVSSLYHKLEEYLRNHSQLEIWTEERLNPLRIEDYNAAINFINEPGVDSQARLFCLVDIDNVFAQTLLQKCDRICLVAQNTLKENILSPTRLRCIKSLISTATRASLILTYDDLEKSKRQTNTWLKTFEYHDNYQVCLNDSNNCDLKRLIRNFTGKGYGLVLSGGGAKGWAHIGVIRALVEANIPIDYIGGTSAGAIIAGLYAASQDISDTLEKLKYLTFDKERIFHWRHLTLPITSIFNYKSNTQKLQEVFSTLYCEDLLLPFFCISTNLNTLSLHVHTQGLVWKAIRASTAIPGLVGPITINGEIHVDGGVINNLPTDIMRQRITPGSKIIAVDISHLAQDTEQYNFPTDVSFLESVGIASRLYGRHYKLPKISDIILRSSLLGAISINMSNRELADHLIIPPIHEFSFSNQSKWQELITLGYEETLKSLDMLTFSESKH